MNGILCGVIVIIQSVFFVVSIVRLIKYKTIFPFADINKYKLSGMQLYAPFNSHESYKSIVESTNKYLEKNEGTADFSLLKDIAERKVELIYEHATSMLSLPMYIGLMGTFVGVGIGLFSLDISGDIGIESINTFINGVIVAMVSSCLGLLLTTIAHIYASSCRGKLDNKKDLYFSFLQTELLPEMGTSIVHSLSQLKRTIGGFEKSFTRVIDRFENTFSSLTNSFGEGFRDNITAIHGAVESLGGNMQKITATMELQKSLLTEIRSEAMIASVKNIYDIFKKFESIVPLLTRFEEEQGKLIGATQNLTEQQNAFVTNLKVPQQILENLNNILNRMSTFEQSINALGENLNESQFLGRRQVNLIEKQLESLEEKQKLALRYTNSGTEQLEQYYSDSIANIDKLRQKVELQLRTAFDLEYEGNSFKHLHHLVSISETLPALKLEVENLKNELLLAKQGHTNDIITAINQKEIIANVEFPNKVLDVNIIKKAGQEIGHDLKTAPQKRDFFQKILGK